MKTFKKLLSALLVVVMFIGVAPIGTISSSAASNVKFSVSVASETDSQVVIALSLEEGSVTSYDIQVNAADYNSSTKTTGLTLSSIAASVSLNDYKKAHSGDNVEPFFSLSRNTGRFSFAGLIAYDTIGVLYNLTFTKSKSDKVKASDFIAVCTSCADGDANSVTATIENKIGNGYQTGDIVEFGSYPQSKVTDSTTLSKLDAVTKNWISYGYYSGMGDYDDGNMAPSDYMKYCDITLDGNKYRAVTFSKYRTYYTGYTANTTASNTYQDDNGYYKDNVYYFKYEPLKWVVLDASTGLVVCDSAIDSQAYNNYVLYQSSDSKYYGDSSKSHYASDWEHSSLRAWLNDDFLNTAFTSTQQSQIKTVTRENKSTYGSTYDSNPTSDKITLLSYWDVLNTGYGFSSSTSSDTARYRKSTDYAQCQGCYTRSASSTYSGNSWWWLRSPGDSYYATGVGHDGWADYGHIGVDGARYGVVPALNFYNLSNLQSSNPNDSDDTCGEALTWTFDESTGTLTTRGAGKFFDFSASTVPWKKYLDQIKKIVISNQATYIGSYAFAGCKNLTSINIPNSVTAIGANAFSGCTSLKTVTIGTGVTSIGSSAFYNCSGITDVYYAGSNLDWDKISIGSNNSCLTNATMHFSLIEGKCGDNLTWEFDSNTGKLTISGTGDMYDFTSGNRPWEEYINDIETLHIGDEVTSIGNYAFYNCINLTDAYIGQKVTRIGKCAFAGCVKLANVNFPEGLKRIEDNAFENTDIPSGELPDGIEYIGNNIFKDCDKLTEVVIPDSVTEIDDFAFYNCSSIKILRIGKSVKRIGNWAFMHCTSLEIIYMPESVETIGDYAFEDCPSITDVYYAGSKSQWQAIDVGLYNDDLLNATIHYGKVDGEEHVHTWGEWTYSKYPTETEQGERYRYCLTCGEKQTEALDEMPTCDHEFTTKITVPSTCKVRGMEYEICDECGATLSVKTLDLADHKYVEQSRTDSTCIKKGTVHKVCSVCGATEDEELPLAEHQLKHIVESSTCTKAGCEYDICSVCGQKFNVKTLALAEHQLKHIVESSTCTKAGCEYDICTVCGQKFNVKTLALAAHKFVEVSREESTCIKKGCIHKACSVCGATLDEELPLAAHKMKYGEVEESTCTEHGSKYDICTVCGEKFNVKELPLADHTWSDWEVTKEPTTREEGLKERSCTVCGKKETETIEKLKAIIDENTGIEIGYEDEFDEGTELSVSEEFDGTAFNLVSKPLGVKKTKLFDITPMRNGEKVQPNGEITVRIPLPEGFDPGNIKIQYVDSINGKVTNVPCEVKDGYVIFKTNHFSYYAIVEMGSGVESVSISNVTMDYKSSKTLNPEIVAADGAEYTITYSSDSKNVTVDENGKIYAAKRGTANITVTVTDSQGNTVTDTCKVTVEYTWWQWLIKIVLFGWIWY